jgi:citrate lyase subunit beta/citryl-CoA lyase
MTIRPRRSVLYMPGSNARALEKAKSLPADGLILDMEDAVAPDAKALARSQIVDAVSQGGYGGRELMVRINALDTPWGADDIRAIGAASVAPDAVLIPKVSTVDDVVTAIAAFEAAGCADTVDFWIMAETPLCILNIRELAAAHPRLKGIVMGTSDLAKETRVRHTPDRIGFIAALSLCVLAARANQLDIIDGVHLNLGDDAGLAAACEQGRDLGFDGKSLIHPKQVAAANAAFGPGEQELESARNIISAWREAEAEGKGVVVVDGKLVEMLHVEEAQRQLELAEAIEQLGQA